MMALLQAAAKIVRITGRAVIFLALVILALNNTQEVGFSLIPGFTWNLPLILLLFIAFATGILLTLVGGLSLRRAKRTHQ
jgi:uncharacterized integral membrane protein